MKNNLAMAKGRAGGLWPEHHAMLCYAMLCYAMPCHALWTEEELLDTNNGN